MAMNETACDARESTLNAVRDDGITIAALLTDLEATVSKLHDHLMGQSPTKEPGLSSVESAPPSGMIHQMLETGVSNISRIRRLQEELNQRCYELGEGR